MNLLFNTFNVKVHVRRLQQDVQRRGGVDGVQRGGQPAGGPLDEHERHAGSDRGGAAEAAGLADQARGQAEQQPKADGGRRRRRREHGRQGTQEYDF